MTVCRVKTVRFKTKRGKVISFKSRCGPKRVSAAQRDQRQIIAAAGRACAKVARPGTKKNIDCLRTKTG